MSLQEFGVERHDRPRLKVKNESGAVACPVTTHPIEYTEGEIEIGVPHLADATLKGALSGAGVSSVRSYGYDSPEAEVVVPETCRGPEAAAWSDEFLGVEVSFPTTPGMSRCVATTSRPRIGTSQRSRRTASRSMTRTNPGPASVTVSTTRRTCVYRPPRRRRGGRLSDCRRTRSGRVAGESVPCRRVRSGGVRRHVHTVSARGCHRTVHIPDSSLSSINQCSSELNKIPL